MRQNQALSLEDAKLIADGVEEKAIQLGQKMAIAIMDEHGNLKYFRRMDGNPMISVRVSQLKAYTSASVPMSTKALADKNAPLDNQPYSSVPGIVLLEGGLPIITKEGQHVGSVGVSGATSDIDGVCAQAGLDKIKHLLK